MMYEERETEECPFCDGDGHNFTALCDQCQGYGKGTLERDGDFTIDTSSAPAVTGRDMVRMERELAKAARGVDKTRRRA